MDIFSLSDPLICSPNRERSNNMFEFSMLTSTDLGPPSPPWEDDDVMMDFKLDDASPCDGVVVFGVNSDVDEFLSCSPTSLRLDSDTDEAITSFLKSSSASQCEDDALCYTDKKSSTSSPWDDAFSESGLLCTSCHVTFDSLESVTEHLCDNSSDALFSDEDNCASLTSSIASQSSSDAWTDYSDADHCSTCNQSFPSLELRSSHRCQQKPDEQPSSETSVGHCSVCKLVFSTPQKLEAHKQNFAARCACCHCSKSFSNVSKLQIHHRKHSKEKPFYCQCCGKHYTHRNTLVRHQQLYCVPLRAKVEGEDQEKTEEVASPLTVKIISNNICLKRSSRETAATTTATATLPNAKKAKFCNNNNNSISKNVNSVVSTACKICDKEFYDVQSLGNHREYHEKQRTCCLCNKVLGNKSKLLIHHRSHTKELPYACNVCDRSFAERSTLTKHAATHGERNFRCNLCDKAFVRKDYLAKHALTHRQTYKCSQCVYVCHERQDIERHVTSVHQGSA